jgi:hypothetical protein
VTAGLLVVVPSRTRPAAVARVVQAWQETGAFGDGAALHWVVDADDPDLPGYVEALAAAADGGAAVTWRVAPLWEPLVPKLNTAAYAAARAGDWEALGFAGDDHLPRTRGWAAEYLAALRTLGTGIVYGDDGYQGARLPTQWAMTRDVVLELGMMVPAPVAHLYCDNAVMDLGAAAGCLTYLPQVLIEHMHPVARKAAPDMQYRRVNSPVQGRMDRARYVAWRAAELPGQAEAVRRLREAAVQP